MNLNTQKAFTLVELIVIMGIISILASVTLVAVNPPKHFSQARDTQRKNDINQLVNAVTQYMSNNNGTVPAAITTTPTVIGSGGGQIDLCTLLVSTYLPEMPFDPQSGNYSNCSSYNTNYSISKSASNSRITVSAPGAENGAITVTR
jgi:prepilin-type N-terminal cleavage/methylation domain-containing protein